MINETHTPPRAMPIRDIIAKMRHDGWGDVLAPARRVRGASWYGPGASVAWGMNCARSLTVRPDIRYSPV
jgi:hypothetical protein